MSAPAFIAFLLAISSASASASEPGGVAVVIEAVAGERVRLAARDGERVALWVELSAPSAVIRGGRSEGGSVVIRPRVPGVYVLGALPSIAASLARAKVYEVHVEAERESAPRARIGGPRLIGSGELVTLSCEVAWPEGATATETRWRQLSGPDLLIDRGSPNAGTLEVKPRFAGRYRIGARSRTERGWTPEAVFAFEVPLGPGGAPARLPVARIRVSGVPRIEGEVSLDASGSTAGGGGEAVFRWFQLDGPPAELLGEGERVSFFPFYPGRYEFALLVEAESGLVSRPGRAVIDVPDGADGEVAGEPYDENAGPLDRPISLLVRDGTIATLTGLLGREGVYVRTAPDLGDPVAISNLPVDLWTVDLPIKKVLDWLGRCLGASYVIQPSGGVWFTRQTDWLASLPQSMRAYRIDALNSKEDAGDIVGMMREAVRAALWLGRGADVGAPDMKHGTIAAILPESAHERLGALIAELRGPVPSGGTGLDVQRGGSALEAKVVADYAGWTFRDIAWDLARQAKVSIGWNPAAVDRERKFDLALGETDLRKALECLAELGGLAGVMAESPRAVWMYEGEEPAFGAQSLWQSALVRSYDIRLLGQRHGFSGAVVTHLIKSRVRPERWKGPFVFVGYSAARQRLVVIHDDEMQRAVAAYLGRLAVEGEDALGE